MLTPANSLCALCAQPCCAQPQVGPFANPSEQYEYYTLPFCAPKEEFRKSQHLGEVLAGDRMMKTLFSLPFEHSFESKKLCSYTLKAKDIEIFQRAIDEDYYFEFIYDDLPLWGFIGDVVTNLVDGRNVTNYHLFTGTKPKTLNPKP